MKTRLIQILLVLNSVTLCVAQTPDWQGVEKVFGRKGTVQGDLIKITFPRADLNVKVGEVRIEPALALTSWIAFKSMKDHVMMMGDLVLLDAEVAPVTSRLIADEIQVTALHNHILGELPHVMYMHFSGHGHPTKLAEAMKGALTLTGTPVSPPQSSPLTAGVDWSKVESTLGWTGQRRGNVLQVGIPRQEKIKEGEEEIPPSMGVATAINFQMVGEKVAATGDFVLAANEVNPVVRSLTEHGIAVTAIHSHMLSETPRLFFLHFWGFDGAEKLAEGLKAALDKTNSTRKK